MCGCRCLKERAQDFPLAAHLWRRCHPMHPEICAPPDTYLIPDKKKASRSSPDFPPNLLKMVPLR